MELLHQKPRPYKRQQHSQTSQFNADISIKPTETYAISLINQQQLLYKPRSTPTSRPKPTKTYSMPPINQRQLPLPISISNQRRRLVPSLPKLTPCLLLTNDKSLYKPRSHINATSRSSLLKLTPYLRLTNDNSFTNLDLISTPTSRPKPTETYTIPLINQRQLLCKPRSHITADISSQAYRNLLHASD
jgi:hypothetical protein